MSWCYCYELLIFEQDQRSCNFYVRGTLTTVRKGRTQYLTVSPSLVRLCTTTVRSGLACYSDSLCAAQPVRCAAGTALLWLSSTRRAGYTAPAWLFLLCSAP